jgi:hypothetical protein
MIYAHKILYPPNLNLGLLVTAQQTYITGSYSCADMIYAHKILYPPNLNLGLLVTAQQS